MEEHKNNISASKRKDRLYDVLAIVVILLFPIIGLFILLNKNVKWSKQGKILSVLIMLLGFPLHLFLSELFWLFIFAPGGISGDLQTTMYLKNKYHEEFVIGENVGSGHFGVSITYGRKVKPKNNPEVEFTVSKCLFWCSSESMDFTDTYATDTWSRQLVKQFSKEMSLDSERQKLQVEVKVDSYDDYNIVARRDGKIPKISELSENEKKTMKIRASYEEKRGVYDWNTRQSHANRIIKLASVIKNTGIKFDSFDYEVKTNISFGNSDDDMYGFGFHTNQPFESKKPDDIYPLFTIRGGFVYNNALVTGYKKQQSKVSISQGDTLEDNSTPTEDDKANASRELKIAKKFQMDIAKDYLIPPMVIADETLETKDSKKNVIVSVYNFPDKAIPVTIDQYKRNIVFAAYVLQNTFAISRLVYYDGSGRLMCEIGGINKNTNLGEKVNECFINSE